MGRRIRALLAARFQAQGKGRSPVAALWSQALLATAAAAILRGEVTAFAFALAALCVSAISVALPLLGELAPLLGDDESGEWLRAQPVSRAEVRIARAVHLAALLGGLGLAAALPWCVMAPGWTVATRVALLLGALGQSFALAAFFVALRALGRGRANWLLVLVQSTLWSVAILGAVFGPRWALRVASADDLPEMLARFAPPARLAQWIAAIHGAAGAAGGVAATSLAASLGALIAFALLALVSLLLLPAPEDGARLRSFSATSWLLQPLKRLAARGWLRRGERASFDLVFDALPLEPEFLLRAYPLLAIPLGFVFVGLRQEPGRQRETLLALLLFLPCMYLPLLVAHTPLSRSAASRWILETSPARRTDIDRGAMKAVALRFVLPLYVLLSACCAGLSGWHFCLRLAPLALAAAWLTLRACWSTFARDLPLAVDPKDVHIDMNWFGPLGGIGLGVALLSAYAVHGIRDPMISLSAAAACFVATHWLDGTRESPAR